MFKPVSGYGDYKSSAETIENGYTYETWYSSDNYAWYKIYCYRTNNLYASVDLNYTIYVRVEIVTENNVIVDYEECYYSLCSSFSVSYTYTMTGYYYICLYRTSSSSTNYIDLYVSGSQQKSVPGHLTIVILFCALGAISLLVYKFFRKNRFRVQE